MITRKKFLLYSGAFAVGTMFLPSFALENNFGIKNLGVQLYTFREAMYTDPIGTLNIIADLGFKKIESAKSNKGFYYGLKPKEMQEVCQNLGMNLLSGHVPLDKDWEKTMNVASAAGQEYLICSSMPFGGQTVDNYKKVAEKFNEVGEACKKMGLKFGYHNQTMEFEAQNGKVLYDVLLEHTDPELVHMEIDLAMLVLAGKDPVTYFAKYPGRFPLWHLKDMIIDKGRSTEFGKGGVDIAGILKHKKEAGLKHIFLEQEEYTSSPYESMRHNVTYLQKLL
ncbi:TIM barrel protein [Salegentibacter sp. F188]|jgi:sugar phosphate isomerase/epimerase|uniref:TIM barrel protein n=1 Tax=Autumnicola patrickiae TaxID=3075591 RepID=A0ABU3E3D2_9FLAO|nr:TIM barrel protein [Salegentibacter sp. F188]MDT0690418.1 TIM barrel protein [Salegentibacter sp. F188]